MTLFPANPSDHAARPTPGDGTGPQIAAVAGEPGALLENPEQRLTRLLQEFNLTLARERLADVVHHSDRTLEQACLTILRLTPDRSPDHITERAEAVNMLQLLRRQDRR